MSNRLSCLGALAAFIVAAFLSPFSRVAGSKGKNFYLYDFCIMKCKMALLLSAFAFAPSVLAEVPLATLSVDNIQVRAEWRVVPQDNPDFRMEGNTLVFQSNISGAGKPNGATIIATVEVLDKFSTLNPLYEDLTTRVKITTVVMGCHGYRWRNFAVSDRLKNGWISARYGFIKKDDVIYRTEGGAGYQQAVLHTVIQVHERVVYRRDGSWHYVKTLPVIPGLKWDGGFYDQSDTGFRGLRVNDAANCFDKDIKALQEANEIYLEQQAKDQYLAANAPPLNTGVYAGDPNVNARVITVGKAFVLPGEQFFWLYDVTLVNILSELYPITVINNDIKNDVNNDNNGGKAFTIVGDPRFYPKGSRDDVNADIYEYVVNLPAGSSGYTRGNHQVIIVNSCPTTPPVSVPVWFNSGNSTLRINPSGISEVASYPYVLIKGDVYKYNGALPADGYSDVPISIGGFSPSGPPGTVWFADHFLCESI